MSDSNSTRRRTRSSEASATKQPCANKRRHLADDDSAANEDTKVAVVSDRLTSSYHDVLSYGPDFLTSSLL